ncbi:MAG: hypothetical protein EZS28_024865 [Streblomastix strix]|uniref:Uncharacterized protein n=1 Tax=Streblomastix strix TaxID=222440 RepID=A0A5J4VAU5_9EUKA|nr:MAG: hypothetical protein EZS28_024865 [Streblomastix strix]
MHLGAGVFKGIRLRFDATGSVAAVAPTAAWMQYWMEKQGGWDCEEEIGEGHGQWASSSSGLHGAGQQFRLAKQQHGGSGS